MKSVCILLQNHYEFDIRVRRKAEALVAAGYSVDVLSLRSSYSEKTYTLGGVNVRTISLGKKRGKASGKARTVSASKKWQDRAIDMANEIRAKKPVFSVAAIATTVEAQWSGTFPVRFRRLYDFLRACNKGGLFEKK